MNFKNFLKVNWLGLIGLLLGIAGVLATIYFYELSKSERQPFLIIDPARVEILSSDRAAGVPITVLRKDGSEIKSSLNAVRFYFWNNGKESIKQSNILQPIIIRIDEPQARIIDFKVLKISREVTNLQIQRNPNDADKSLLITFSILEQFDGVTGQIIYEGNPNSSISTLGVIEGAENIQTVSSLKPSFLWDVTFPFFKLFLSGLIIIILALIFVGVVINLDMFIARRFPNKRRIISKVFSIMGTCLIVSFFVIIFGVIGWSILRQANKNNIERTIQSVPTRVLP